MEVPLYDELRPNNVIEEMGIKIKSKELWDNIL